jgi:hypothetical protein
MNTPWVSVRISGMPIQDIFVYRTSVLAWLFGGRIILFEVSAIEMAIKQALSSDTDRAKAICFLLFHSGAKGVPKGESLFKGLLFDLTEDLEITLDGSEIRYLEIATSLQSSDLLDILVYWDRTYLSTAQGLFQGIWPDQETRVAEFDERISYACYSASASLGSIAASCGPSGLRILFDGFQEPQVNLSHSKTIDEQSDRSEFGIGGLFNYSSRGSVSYFKTLTVENPDKRKNVPNKLIADIQESRILASEDSESPNRVFTEDELDYIYYSHQRLIALHEGEIFATVLRSYANEVRLAKRVNLIGNYVGFPLTACDTSSTTLIETTEGIVTTILESGESLYRPTGPTVSLRTFPRSKRYLNLAIRTDETGAYLFAAVPNTPDIHSSPDT